MPDPRHLNCRLECEIPAGVELVEVPQPRHGWSDVYNCPNDGCGRSFIARKQRDADA